MEQHDTANQREIAVMDGAEALETRLCDLWVMPDGRMGAAWRGLVFALTEEDSIDISHSAVPVQACRAAAQAKRSRYAMISGATEAYVLVEGDRAVCDGAVVALRGAGSKVLRMGRYLGDPPEWAAPDWFVRIAAVPDEAIDAALAGVFDRSANDPAPSLQELRIRLLETDLLAARQREAGLQAELATLRQRAAATAEEAAFQQALAEEALAEEQRLRALAETQAAAPVPRPAVPPRLQEEVALVLATLLPKLQLVRDSATVVAVEFAGRRALWRALGELHTSAMPPAGWKKIHAAEGWWERHVSNGQDDAGRIYARRSDGGGWDVLVSHKGDQPRDLAWLARQ